MHPRPLSASSAGELVGRRHFMLAVHVDIWTTASVKELAVFGTKRSVDPPAEAVILFFHRCFSGSLLAGHVCRRAGPVSTRRLP